MGIGLVPENAQRLTRPPTVVGIAVALFAPPVLTALPIDGGELTSDIVKWLLVALLLGVVVALEGKSVSSVGFVRPRLADLAWTLAVAVLGVGVFVVTGPVITGMGLPVREGIPEPSLLYGLFSAFTAGVTEEILFRGYPIERLTDAGYGSIAAGGITWGLFTAVHAPSYPAGNLLQIGLVGLVLTAVYVRTRSLLPVIVGHVAIDVVGVLVYLFG